MSEAETIAKGLTPTMRTAVLHFPASGGYIQYHGVGLHTAKALSNRGVFGISENYARIFTPLGLAVRLALQEQ